MDLLEVFEHLLAVACEFGEVSAEALDAGLAGAELVPLAPTRLFEERRQLQLRLSV